MRTVAIKRIRPANPKIRTSTTISREFRLRDKRFLIAIVSIIAWFLGIFMIGLVPKSEGLWR